MTVYRIFLSATQDGGKVVVRLHADGDKLILKSRDLMAGYDLCKLLDVRPKIELEGPGHRVLIVDRARFEARLAERLTATMEDENDAPVSDSADAGILIRIDRAPESEEK